MNTCEKQVAAALEAEGWQVLRNGWPDFLCWRDRPSGVPEVMCVEVKDESTGDRLRPSQVINHSVLKAIGLRVRVVGTSFIEAPEMISRKKAAAQARWQNPEYRAAHKKSMAKSKTRRKISAGVKAMHARLGSL
jgi:hypothetical protein